MSEIKRTLTGGNTVNIAGPAGGGGIVMQKPAATECPACAGGGGDCVPDNFQAMWLYTQSYQSTGTLTTNDLTLYNNNINPTVALLMSVVVDPAVSAIGDDNLTHLCCDTITWSIVADSGFEWVQLNGDIVIRKAPGSGGTITLTPTVCGNTLNTLTYLFEGI